MTRKACGAKAAWAPAAEAPEDYLPGAERFLSPLAGWSVKVRRLVGYPVNETADRLPGQRRLPVRPDLRQFRIGEIGVDRAVADRVQRHGFAPTLRLGHRMVPLYPPPKWTMAKPAAPLLSHRAWEEASNRPFCQSNRPAPMIMADPIMVGQSGMSPNTAQPSAVAISNCT